MAALLVLTGCAGVRPAPPPPPQGYLVEADHLTIAQTSSPSPVPEDASAFDVIAPGTDRWWLAIAHAELRAPYAAQHFDCVLDTRLNQRPRPALTRLMQRLLVDADALTRGLAVRHPRPRPVAAIAGLEPCQRTDRAMLQSPSWPASGAVTGAVYGELFADLAPDRADAARKTGQEIGRSRMLCRMNWPSDVADGYALGRTLYARVAQEPSFRRDLEAARAEMAEARAETLSNPGCAAERRALVQAGRGAASAP
jgi:acid phosphatase (class A)